MKKRVAGGVVLVAIGIGIWLSNLFQGIGPGGAGTNIGMNPSAAVSLDPSGSASGSAAETEGKGPVTTAITGRPVVVIDGQEYFVEVRAEDDTALQPVLLQQIIDAAMTAEPNADGIRVQIKRRGSSRHSAEAALDAALRDAGITEEQIQRHAGFVE